MHPLLHHMGLYKYQALSLSPFPFLISSFALWEEQLESSPITKPSIMLREGTKKHI